MRTSLKALVALAVTLAATLGLLANYAQGTAGKSLVYPSTTVGCTAVDTISSCYDAAGAGGTVTVKPGHYNTSAATITLDHTGTLKGTCGTTIFDTKNKVSGITVTSDNVSISCLTIMNPGYSGAGVIDAASHNLHIDKLTVISAYNGVEAGGSGAADGLQVTNSSFSGVGSALNLVHTSTSILFSGNKVSGATSNCVVLNAAVTSSTISKNTLTNCAQYGVETVGGSNITITGNTITAAGGGIYATSAGPTVSSNKLTGIGSSGGIIIGNFFTASDNAVITGNTLSASISGISVYGAAPDVEKNTVSSILGGGQGIFVNCTASCTTLKVLSNSATGATTGLFVQISADATGGIVSKNTANANITQGIYIVSGNSYYGGLMISGNTASDNGGGMSDYQAGIALQYSNNDTVTGNTASSNGGAGFYTGYVSGTMLTNNTAKTNTLDGFELAEGSPTTTMTKNTATGNLGDGFNTDQHDTVFTNNTASGSGDYDCTYDKSEDGNNDFNASSTGNKCADKSNFGVESLLTDN